MKQFKNILVVGPFDKQIIGRATELMRTSQSRLTLMSVVPELEPASVVTGGGKEICLQSLLESGELADLESLARPFRFDNFHVETIVNSGNQAFLNVIRQVRQNKHDLVMMLADGLNQVRDQLFGTLSMHLMRKCPCAVWVVKPSRRKKLRNVFAAVDPDPDNPQRDQLSIDILNRATAVAQNHGAQLHIIHAWRSLSGEVNRCRQWLSKQEIRLHIENVKQSHRNRLGQLLKQNSVGSEIIHIIQGRPGIVIPEMVSMHNADLLVMGTVCRTGIPGFFIGNSAESILNQVDCSVLTVKPKKFISPVLAGH